MSRFGSKPFRGPIPPYMLANARVIAKGRKIRDRKRLVETYGGQPSEWTKKSGPVDHDGKQFYELHWYQHQLIGIPEDEVKKVFLNSP